MDDSTLTLDKLRAAMKLVQDIPPPPFLAMCKLLPADNFTRFEHEGREYWGAHPDLWEQVPKGTFDQMGRLTFKVHNLDWDLNAKAEFFTALMSVIQPKAPPHDS